MITHKFGMAEDNSTYVYTEDVSETAKPSTQVTKGTLRMSNVSAPVMKPSAKWQRKIKLLPDSIADMTSVDSHRQVISEELKTYEKSLHVVSRVKGIGQNNKDIVLDHLTTDQVCLFARNIGVPNLGLKNKFACLLAIASHFKFQQQLSNFGLSPPARANQTTANICRAVNVIYSEQLIEDLKKSTIGKVGQIMNPGIPTTISGQGRQWHITIDWIMMSWKTDLQNTQLLQFLKIMSQQQMMTLQPSLFPMTILYLLSWTQMKKST